jgi:hypothetical protein
MIYTSIIPIWNRFEHSNYFYKRDNDVGSDKKVSRIDVIGDNCNMKMHILDSTFDEEQNES